MFCIFSLELPGHVCRQVVMCWTKVPSSSSDAYSTQKKSSRWSLWASLQPWVPTVQLVSCHNASVHFLTQQHYCQTSLTCWHATKLQVWWLLVFPYFLSHDWSGTRLQQVHRKAAGNCEPNDLSRFVVDLRETLEVLDTLSDGCPREHNSKILTYNRWFAPSPIKALATRSPHSLPNYMFLDLP
jgi:hypothetical protein